MDSHFDCPLAHRQMLCRFRLRKTFRVPGQPWLKGVKNLFPVRGLVLLAQLFHGAVQDVQCPLPIELVFRGAGMRIGRIKTGRSVGAGLNAYMFLLPAAFACTLTFLYPNVA